MTNREQLGWSFQHGDYADEDLAEILIDFMWAINAVPADKKGIEMWLGLECDKENNWGILPAEEEDG